MAEAIVIRVTLEPTDIAAAGQKIAKQLQSAIDSGLSGIKSAGGKVGDALSDGMAAAAAKAQATIATINRKGANDRLTIEKQHQAKIEQEALRSVGRLESIATKSAASIRDIEAKKQAQLDLLRERFAQREIERQRKLDRQAQQNTGALNFIRRFSSTVREAGESIQQAGSVFTGIGAQITNIGRSSIEAAGKIESITRSFGLLDKDKSTETLARLRKQADDLKASFIGYAEQVNRVRQTQKLTADQSEKLVQGLINVGRAAGVSREAQDRAVTALNQILAKNKVTAEELRGQLLEAIPNLAPIIEKRFGSLNAEFLEKNFGAKKFVAGLIEEFSKLNKLEPTALEKFQVSLENLQIKLAPVGNKILEFLNRNIEPLTKAVESLINAFNGLSPATQELIIKFGFLLVVLGPVLRTFGALVQLTGGIGNLIAVISRLGVVSVGTTGAVSGLGAAILALNPIVLGIGIAVAAGTVLWLGYKNAMGNIEDRFASIEQSAARARGEVTLLDGTIQRASDQSFQLNQAEDPRLKNLKIKTGQVVDFGNAVKVDANGRPVNPADNLSFSPGLGVPNPTKPTGGGGSSRESAARALREAQLQDQKSFLEQNQKLLEDSAKRELETIKFAFDEKLLSAQSYYENKTILEQRSLRGAIGVTQEEISAANNARNAAIVGTPERIRLDTQLYELRIKQQIQSREFYRTEIDNIRAITATLKAETQDALAEINKLGLSPVEGQLPTDLIARTANPFEEEARRKLAVAQQATIDFRLKDLELQRQEVAIQNAVTTGQLNEAQAKEATLALQRQYGAELIRQLELQKQNAALTDEQLGQLNVQIEQLKTLGSELSPAEAFFKGLRSQAETTAEAFERIGQRFKESVLSPIDSGIDKLTEKLGIFKDVLGDILKLLARQVINKLFGGGGSFGGGQQGGGSFSLGGLVGAVTGGGGGGGGASFGGASTGGFAGGNPVQQILGGGSGGSGGGISGLIQKIPVLGKLFGAGGKSLVGGIGPNIGSLPGGIQGVGIPPLTGPASAGGAGALGGLSGLLGPAAIAGGGILGSLAGGKNKFGQLLGGVGGSLLAGFGAAALNPALLPVLFSNPITAVIGGALIGGALLVNFLSGREQRRFRKEVENAYQVKVDGKEQGTALYKSIKSLGEEKFGKGKFGKNLVPTIQLEKAKDQIAAYGEATGQNNVPLVIEFRNRRGLQNADDPRNQFPRFAFGGFVPFPDLGRDSVLTALRGREYVTRPEIVAREGVGAFDALNAGQATIAPVQGKASGGFVQPSTVRISSGSSNGDSRGGIFGKLLERLDELLKMNLEATIQQIEIGERIRGVSPGAVLVAGTREPIAQNAIADAAGDAMEQGTSGGRRMLTATRRPR